MKIMENIDTVINKIKIFFNMIQNLSYFCVFHKSLSGFSKYPELVVLARMLFNL